MRRRLREIETRRLPCGWPDVLRQLTLFAGVYLLYEIVRAAVAAGSQGKPFDDATRVIDLERGLHIFAEPSLQAWAKSMPWLIDLADWTYLNAHTIVTLGALVFIYLRRNDSFCFIRNMFMIAMMIALVGYALYPTAPPRLMPEWGFTDSVARFLGTSRIDDGPGRELLNFYAAIPSMHVCFAVMVGVPMARLVTRWWVRVTWCLYPLLISFVVIVTGNHYFTDVLLGVLTAAASALLAARLLARARPDRWTFSGATA
ncbi:MAG TPA: phosphatase PAP2 family protein [Solirubrobacteraceae bacterium]